MDCQRRVDSLGGFPMRVLDRFRPAAKRLLVLFGAACLGVLLSERAKGASRTIGPGQVVGMSEDWVLDGDDVLEVNGTSDRPCRVRAAARIRAEERPARLVVCGRRDAGLVVCLAAAIDPTFDAVAVEETPLSYWPLFEAAGQPVNAAGLLPRVLRDFGDIAAVLAACAPRRVLAAAAIGDPDRAVPNLTRTDRKFTVEAGVLLDWLRP
jgi:hypothetical protein